MTVEELLQKLELNKRTLILFSDGKNWHIVKKCTGRWLLTECGENREGISPEKREVYLHSESGGLTLKKFCGHCLAVAVCEYLEEGGEIDGS